MRHHATSWLSLVVCLPGLAFAQAEANVDRFAQQVVAALKAKDQQALQALAVDQSEFKKYIWPTIASHIRDNADKFYSTYSKNSDIALEKQLSDFGGKDLTVVKVNTGPEKRYSGYRLLPNPEIAVREGNGQEHVLKLGSALLDHDGQLKVTSYYRASSTSAVH